MNRIKQGGYMLLVLLALFILPSTCSAAAEPTDLALLTELEGNMITLSTTLNQSKQDLAIASNKLNLAETKLEKVNKQLTESRIDNAKLGTSLQNLKALSENLNKELKREKKRKNIENIVWGLVGAAVGFIAAK